MSTRLSRRDFLKISALTGAVVGLSATAAQKLLKLGYLNKVHDSQMLMGTIVNFEVVAESKDQAQAAIQATVDEMRHLISVFDYRLESSALGQLNSTGITRNPPHELVDMLRQALHFGTLSNGAFDVTVQPMLDASRENRPATPDIRALVDYRLLNVTNDEISLARPGMAVTADGIAKGWVVDGGVAILRQLGFEQVLVEAGGDMLAKSTQAGQVWKIGIAHPRNKGEFAAIIGIQNQAVATSGDYMNYFSADHSAYHIIDPRTGHSPAELASATVIAPSVAEADALSTTMMVLGAQEGLALIERLPEMAALLISKDLQIYRSSKFPTE
ncbi:MAG: FAD:protein FMN transferase [Chloroflexi bacterium]|nr:FAD:protein FMN transferase [Chloroflexota bacterium]